MNEGGFHEQVGSNFVSCGMNGGQFDQWMQVGDGTAPDEVQSSRTGFRAVMVDGLTKRNQLITRSMISEHWNRSK